VGDEALRQRRDLQGARGVGVTLVVIGHLFLWPTGVFAALDIFFVLSGYLITGILLSTLAQHGARFFPVFYLSRVRRLVPMAVLVLLVTVAGTYLVFSGARGSLVAEDALWAFFFLVNWHFIAEGSDYFAIHTASPLQHYWSLSVEEQFYLVWPLLVLLALFVAARTRRRTASLAGVLGAVTVVSFGYSLWHSAAEPGAAYFSTVDRAWEFGVGGLLAVAAPRLTGLARPLREVLSWVGVVGILTVIFVLEPGVAFPAPLGLLPVALTACIIVGGLGEEPRTQWFLDNPVAVYVGNISYSVYLWHMPVQVLLAPSLGQDTLGFYVACLATTALLSVASYHLVERPLRNARFLMLPAERRRKAPRPFLDAGTSRFVKQWGMLTAFCLALATIYAGISYTRAGSGPAVAADDAPALAVEAQQQRLRAARDADGFPAFSPSLDQLAAWDSFDDSREGTSCVDVPLADPLSCRYGDPAAQRTVLVAGDSFAISWMPTIQAAFTARGWQVQQLTAAECPTWTLPSYLRRDRTAFPACGELHDAVQAYVAQQQPDLVLLASAYDQVLNAQRDDLGRPDPATLAEQGLTATIRAFPEGTEVAVLQPPPNHENLLECVYRGARPADCTSDPYEFWYQHTAGERAAAAATGATYVETLEWFCVNERCPGFVGSTPVTVDGSHLSVAFARQLAPLLATALGLPASPLVAA
jgi:peptidoglycan/LPS O-acetylase OafA/YrhL